MKKTISKKLALLFSALLLLVGSTISAATIDFGVCIIDLKPGYPGSSKSPVNTPCVDIEGNVLTFDVGHDDYTLCIVDNDDNIVHSVYVPSMQTTVILPSSLSGDYELRLIPNDGNIYFYGYVMF